MKRGVEKCPYFSNQGVIVPKSVTSSQHSTSNVQHWYNAHSCLRPREKWRSDWWGYVHLFNSYKWKQMVLSNTLESRERDKSLNFAIVRLLFIKKAHLISDVIDVWDILTSANKDRAILNAPHCPSDILVSSCSPMLAEPETRSFSCGHLRQSKLWRLFPHDVMPLSCGCGVKR